MQELISLSASEAVCLEALRSGTERKMMIALRASLNLRQTGLALEKLASLDLAVADGRRNWTVTPRGRRAAILIAPAVEGRGPKPPTATAPGASAARLLSFLDQPRRGTELTTLMEVTRQRVDQLVVALSALGLIRSADPNCPTFAIALKDDPSILLRHDQERVLSAFPETKPTKLTKIAAVTTMQVGRVAELAESLIALGLIDKAVGANHEDLFRLTAAGSAHWQRSATARRADIPSPPFRSDRVREVLSYLESHGPTRTRDVGLRLRIPQPSINALMQYLKRRKAVCTQADGRYAPYGLTPDGREMLAAMDGVRQGPNEALLRSASRPAAISGQRGTATEDPARNGSCRSVGMIG